MVASRARCSTSVGEMTHQGLGAGNSNTEKMKRKAASIDSEKKKIHVVPSSKKIKK